MAEKEENNEKKEEKSKPELPKEEQVVTNHSITIRGKEIKYTATTGTIILKEEEEEKEPQAKASIFYIAYTLDDVEDKGSRPITYSFNGGPGSSSVWLHLGVLGPKRVIAEINEKPVPPPYSLVENEFSLLDITDLVFIDPVSTGYSRSVPGEKAKQFHEYKRDIKSVGEFIRLYTSRFKRWTSPKFLIGESYGTTRAAGLAGYLQNDLGMYLNGIMFVSSILNFQTARFVPGNDLPSILFLPTYTATAFYHNRLETELQADLQKTLSEVLEFTDNEYTLALMKGDKLPEDEKNNIIAKLAKFTGLSPEYIDATNLRVNIHRFVKELLRDQKRTVGRLDSRFIGIDRDSTGAENDYDPSYAAIHGPYTATLNDYVRRDLNFESDLPYEILAPLYENWKFEDYHNQYLNVGETLREAMSKNQHLKVIICNGYFDLATPFHATEYTFDHLGLDKTLQDNISMTYYEAGHMMYLHEPSLLKLRDDLKKFMESTIQM
ncbi:MAG: S10 family peptidase [Candidatus Kariarchaeaceae archaeon]|jgi:carboxypeptidase C (cathepsin A)